jgi:hypothetical protein
MVETITKGDKTYRVYKDVKWLADDTACEYVFVVNTSSGNAFAMSRERYRQTFESTEK